MTATATIPTQIQAAPQSLIVQAEQFTVGEPVKEDSQLVPVDLVALSGKPIDWWAVDAPLYFDLSGMKTNKDRIVMDWIHDYNEPVGFIDDYDTSDAKLTCKGKLTPIFEGDRADRIAKQGKLGVPFEASITWLPETLDYVGKSVELELDGRTIEGPAYIARTWTLRAVAVCPLGQDAHTLAKFSAPDKGESLLTFTVNNTSGDYAVSDQDQTTPSSTETDVDSSTETTETVSTDTSSESSVTEPVDFAAAAKPFIENFGEARGAVLFAQGKTMEEAQAIELKRLRDENEQLREGQAGSNTDNKSGVKFSAAGGGEKKSPFSIRK
jgi:hypothetical protein